MGFVDDELEEVKKLCERTVPGCHLRSCVRCMVRIEIRFTRVRNIVTCFQFPEEYPAVPILFELKSKTLSENLLKKLTTACENEISVNLISKPQILKLVRFVAEFLRDNPLSSCFEEISQLKKELGSGDELKIKQKKSSLGLKINEGLYWTNAKILVPDEYPDQPVSVEVESNFPSVLDRFLSCQAREEARKCVEPPILRKTKPNAPPPPVFSPSPSLLPVARHLLTQTRLFPSTVCFVCTQTCLPKDPRAAVTDESEDLHVERIYCGHLIHNKCLVIYMKTPPFQGGKKCGVCGLKIYHDKWRVSEKLAEDRWAHKEARARELDEVSDFFK